jgi:hypothetical protein
MSIVVPIMDATDLPQVLGPQILDQAKSLSLRENADDQKQLSRKETLGNLRKRRQLNHLIAPLQPIAESPYELDHCFACQKSYTRHHNHLAYIKIEQSAQAAMYLCSDCNKPLDRKSDRKRYQESNS